MPYEEQFAALAHPLRQNILDALQQAPATVGKLTERGPVAMEPNLGRPTAGTARASSGTQSSP